MYECQYSIDVCSLESNIIKDLGTNVFRTRSNTYFKIYTDFQVDTIKLNTEWEKFSNTL